MKRPDQYARKILLAIIGKTPQIFTETLYKLAVQSTPAFVPTEIHMITTQEGARSAQLALLGVGRGGGEFHQFCSDFGFQNIKFDSDHIHIISDTEGQFIDDNQSTEHNRIASDFITDKVREFTSDHNSAVHLSLAGGRKTMSFYAGYALSLYGRMQDRLSHVLVSEPFQNNLDFFYPRPNPERIKIDNAYYSTDEARIILSDIPYVRMRYQVPEALLEGNAGFQETVAAIQRFAQAAAIEIDTAKKKVRLNGMKVKMSDADLALYLWMCERRKQNKHPFVPDADAFVEDYIEVYARIVGEWSGMIDRVEEVARKRTAEQQKEWFQQRKSKLKKAIAAVLGNRLADPFLIQTTEYRGQVAYEINLKSEAITIQ
ncbi:MAG: TIGR02584 family CRISPR-associated protein [Gammaproteobacteria bacterium]|nr:MAG: TIGR02584 family CRISPR-associated protein [Gammaproteobacteria bacterium]